MAIYLCRWPNGDFSIVSARSKSDAIEMLDEWGNAEQAIISRITDCMFDFRQSDDGQIELASIGESAEEHSMKRCYSDPGARAYQHGCATAGRQWAGLAARYTADLRERMATTAERWR